MNLLSTRPLILLVLIACQKLRHKAKQNKSVLLVRRRPPFTKYFSPLIPWHSPGGGSSWGQAIVSYCASSLLQTSLPSDHQRGTQIHLCNVQLEHSGQFEVNPVQDILMSYLYLSPWWQSIAGHTEMHTGTHSPSCGLSLPLSRVKALPQTHAQMILLSW